ncbi:hypothetical protein Ciccas_004064 [Cichlidogyrus casuarinus]|uniref:Uncharacterized protein n=1 Tax=Cichlidogyrus casuarinus TaxID=1844966 RepID=A0ABD2QCK8_9PLAT
MTLDFAAFNEDLPVLISFCDVLRVSFLDGCPYFDTLNPDQEIFSSYKQDCKTDLGKRVSALKDYFEKNPLSIDLFYGELRSFILPDPSSEQCIGLFESICRPIQPLQALDDDTNESKMFETPSILFGSAPSIIQILLSLACSHLKTRDLLLSLIVKECPYSLLLLTQFRRPFGLNYLFSNCDWLEDSCSKLIEILLRNKDLNLQLEILSLLPEFVCPAVYSGMLFSEAKPFNLLPDLLQLLKQLTDAPDTKCDLLSALISCILNFGVSEQDTLTVDKCILNFLHNSASTPQHLDAAALAFSHLDSRNLTRLRSRIRITPNFDFKDSMTNFLKKLSIHVQFDSKLTTDWLKLIINDRDDDSPDQQMQDFLMLVLLYSSGRSFTQTLSQVRLSRSEEPTLSIGLRSNFTRPFGPVKAGATHCLDWILAKYFPWGLFEQRALLSFHVEYSSNASSNYQ